MRPSLNRSQLRFLSLATAALASTAAANAQTKPPPPPPAVEVSAPPEINAAEFKLAYEQADRPVLLTLVGFATGEREASQVEKTLWSIDESGFTFALRSAFNEFVNDPRIGVELVSPTQLADSVNRVKDRLDIRRESEALRLIAGEARADLVVTIRLFGDRNGGNPTRGQMEVTDARGREVQSFPFQWNVPDTSLVTIRGIARLLAVEFTNSFIQRDRQTQRWTVRLFDLNKAEAVLALRERLEQTAGIDRVVPRRSAGGLGDAYREFEISTSVDALELEVLFGRALEPMGLAAQNLGAERGVLSLRVSPAPATSSTPATTPAPTPAPTPAAGG